MTATVRGDCPTPVPDPQTGVVEVTVTDGQNPAITTKPDGKFVLVWQTLPIPGIGDANQIRAVRLDETGACLLNQADLIPHNNNVRNEFPSVTMNSSGSIVAAFTSNRFGNCIVFTSTTVLRLLPFDFGDAAQPFVISPMAVPAPCQNTPGNATPSAALDGASCASTSWTNDYGSAFSVPQGLVLQVCNSAAQGLRGCNQPQGGDDYCFTDRWRPCLAARDDGYVATVWADAESSMNSGSPMNIVLRVFQADGNPATDEISVNDVFADRPLSSQESPAVAFHDTGRIAVVWTGMWPTGCGDPGDTSLHVYSKTYAWTPGGEPTTIVWQSVVDDDPTFALADTPNPVVAFDASAIYVIAWNASGLGRQEVHARRFNSDGFALGHEFRVNVATGPTGPGGESIRGVGTSAQHTCVLDAFGRIAAAWMTSPDNYVNVTIIPESFVLGLCCAEACCRADYDGNGRVNGEDIQAFVKLLFSYSPSPTGKCLLPPFLCAADLDGDCVFTEKDYDPFLCILLGYPGCTPCAVGGCSVGAPEQPSAPPDPESVAMGDCNDNGVPDWEDLASGGSPDCNQNGRPDECDLAFEVSVTDFNRNFIPDECEPQMPSTAAPSGTNVSIDRAAVLQEMTRWFHSVDRTGMRAWELGYQMKLKFNELGVDMRSLPLGQ